MTTAPGETGTGDGATERNASAYPSVVRRMPGIRVSPAAGFWFVAASFAALMSFGTTPTPLWPLYQERDTLDTTTVTIAFAITVVGAAAGFATLGHLSDRLGRRRIIVPALLVAIVAALVLAIWHGLAGLLVGRFLTGIGIGLMASTATAYLIDLYHLAHPGRAGSPVPIVIAAAANLGGLALGPLVAGAIAEWAPEPLVTSYVVCATAMAILLVPVLLTPETVDAGLRSAERPRRFALRPGRGVSFAAAGTIGFFVYAMMGLFSSLGSIIVHEQIGILSHFVAALVPFAVFAASAVTQLALGSLRQTRLLVLGAVLFPIGFALTTIALYQPIFAAQGLWYSLAGAAVCGAGAGLLFKAAVAQTAVAADPASRAGVLAIFFVISFLGMGIPPVAFSIVLHVVDIRASMIGFAAVLSAGVVAAVVASVRSAARPMR